jgi:hypothetical protein
VPKQALLLFLIKCYGGVSCIPVPDLNDTKNDDSQAAVGQHVESGQAESGAQTREPPSTAAAAATNGAPSWQTGAARSRPTRARNGPTVLRAMSEWRRRLLQHGGGALMFGRHTLFQSYRSGDVVIDRAHEHAAAGGVTVAVVKRVCQDACATAPRKVRSKDASAGQGGRMSQFDDLRSAIRNMVGRDLNSNDDFGRIGSASETWNWSAADCVRPSAVGSFTGCVQAPLGEPEALGPGDSTGYGEDRTAAGSEGVEGVHHDAFPVFRHAYTRGWATGHALDQVGGLEQLMTDVVADELGVSATAVHWMVSCITDLLLAAAAESPEWVLESTASAASDTLHPLDGTPDPAAETAPIVQKSPDAEGKESDAHEGSMDLGNLSLGERRLQPRNNLSPAKSELLRHLYILYAWKLPSDVWRRPTKPRRSTRQPATSNAFTDDSKWAASRRDSPNSGERRDVAVEVQDQYGQNQLQPGHREQEQMHHEEEEEERGEEEEEAYDGGEGEEDQDRVVDADRGNTVDEIVAKSRKRKRQRKGKKLKKEKEEEEAYDGGGEGEEDQDRVVDADRGNTVDGIVAKSRKRKRQRKGKKLKKEKEKRS